MKNTRKELRAVFAAACFAVLMLAVLSWGGMTAAGAPSIILTAANPSATVSIEASVIIPITVTAPSHGSVTITSPGGSSAWNDPSLFNTAFTRIAFQNYANWGFTHTVPTGTTFNGFLGIGPETGSIPGWPTGSRTVTVTATFPPAAGMTATLSNPDFGVRAVGYNSVTQRTVTVTNTGTQNLTLSSLPAVPNWTLTQGANWTTPVPPGATRSFTIRPDWGLLTGIYSPTIIVSGTSGGANVTAQINPTFTVVGITAAASLDFGSHPFNYTQRPLRTVTITNAGPLNMTLNALPAVPNWTLTQGANWTTPVPPGATRSFTIRPNDGLPAGTHSPTIIVSGTSGGANVTAQINPTFTVAPPAQTNTISGLFGPPPPPDAFHLQVATRRGYVVLINLETGIRTTTAVYSSTNISQAEFQITDVPNGTYRLVFVPNGMRPVISDAIVVNDNSHVVNATHFTAGANHRILLVRLTGLPSQNPSGTTVRLGDVNLISPSLNATNHLWHRIGDGANDSWGGIGYLTASSPGFANPPGINVTAATYQDRIAVVTMHFEEAAPVDPIVDMTVSPAEPDFGIHAGGYSQQPPMTVTVTNTGNQDITLSSLPTVPNWTLTPSYDWHEPMTPGTMRSFTISPNNGLPVGLYNPVITIWGASGIQSVSRQIQPVFTVVGISAAPDLLDFGYHITGLAQLPEQTVTIKNFGYWDVSLSGLPTVPNWTLTPSYDWHEPIPSGVARTFTIRPNDGLPPGLYSATITIWGTSGSVSMNAQIQVAVEILMPPPPAEITIIGVYPDNAGTALGGGTFDHGATVILYATQIFPWEFIGWFDADNEDEDVMLYPNRLWRFDAAQDKTVQARFEEWRTIIVTHSPPGGGTAGVIVGGERGQIGRLVTVSADANRGWTFAGWYEYSARVAGDPLAIHSFFAESHRSLEARFIQHNQPYLSVTTPSAIMGNIVSVDFYIYNNPGIHDITLYVEFDSSRLEIINWSAGILPNLIPPVGTASPMRFILNRGEQINVYEDGRVLTVNFRVREEAGTGFAEITARAAYPASHAIILAGDRLTPIISSVMFANGGLGRGGVHVVDVLLGDTNNDGVVNMNDVLWIRLWLGGHPVALNEAAADVDGEPGIDSRDATWLTAYVAGIPGVLLIPPALPPALSPPFRAPLTPTDIIPEAVQMRLENDCSAPDGYIDVQVFLDYNPGLIIAHLNLRFNAATASPVDWVGGPALAGFEFDRFPELTPEPGNFPMIFTSRNITENITDTGLLGTFRLRVDDAGATGIDFTLTYDVLSKLDTTGMQIIAHTLEAEPLLLALPIVCGCYEPPVCEYCTEEICACPQVYAITAADGIQLLGEFFVKTLNITIPRNVNFKDYIVVVQYRSAQGINILQLLPAAAETAIFIQNNPAITFTGIDVWLSAGIPSGLSNNFDPLVIPAAELTIEPLYLP